MLRGFSVLTFGKERGNEKNRAASLRGKISSHSQLRVSSSSQRRASEARLFSLPLPLVHAVPLSLLREGDPATMPTGADFGVTLVRFSFFVLFPVPSLRSSNDACRFRTRDFPCSDPSSKPSPSPDGTGNTQNASRTKKRAPSKLSHEKKRERMKV